MPASRSNIVLLGVDIALGLIVGGVLAVITAFVAIIVEDIRIQRPANGWITTLECGPHRNDILRRAACAIDVAALNLPAEEVYWQTYVDGARRRLNGRHDYVLRFPPGGLPPNAAAWSLTMGDWRRRMVANPIQRYSVGDRSGLAPNADGSVDIYIQSAAPTSRQSNWLPAPSGDFMLWLRVYEPGADVLSGAYRPPAVQQVAGGRP